MEDGCAHVLCNGNHLTECASQYITLYILRIQLLFVSYTPLSQKNEIREKVLCVGLKTSYFLSVVPWRHAYQQ